MAGPLYPNVPVASGVPPVKRDGSNPGTDTQSQLSSDAITVTATGKNQWGVYTEDNAKALSPDTIIALGYDAEHRIADFPVEQGGFETYDKVAMPFDVRVVMTKGGRTEDRRAFLAAVEELRGDLKLYSVVTPERTYLKTNISRVSIDRSREQGAGLITVELHLREIRQNVTTSFSNSKDAASASPVSAGAVQPKAAVPTVAQAVSGKVAAAPAGSLLPKFFDTTAGRAIATLPVLLNTPSQVLRAQLAGQAVQIALTQKRTGLFADVLAGGTQIAAGVLCRDGVPILPMSGSLFPGNIALFDTLGSADPIFSGLGDRFHLVWGV